MATYYWVGGSGTWDNVSTANWSASSGGAGGAGPPLAADTVIFDDNSGSGTCTKASTAVCDVITLNSAVCSLLFSSNHTMTGAFTLTKGALDLNGFVLQCGVFTSNNSNTRSISFGSTGKIVCTVLSGVPWDIRSFTGLTLTGSKAVDLVSASSSTFTLYHRGFPSSETASISLTINIPSGAITLASASDFLNLNLSSVGTASLANNAELNIYGDLTLGSNMTLTAGTNFWRFGATSGTKTITTNGKTLDFPLVFNGVGGAWQLQDNLVLGATRALTLTNGTLNGNGKNVTTGTFALGAGTKTLTLGSGTWTVAGATWDANTNVANLTVSASTGVISMTSASAKTFAGGAKTWPTLNQGGAGALTVQQSNTFANITNTVQPATITLTSGTTQTVTSFTASGTSGNLITLNSSSAGNRATLTDSGGVNSVSFMDIKDIAATGYGEWQAYTSNGNVNSGNNVGWVFDAPPAFVASEYPPELRSFTEKRRF